MFHPFRSFFIIPPFVVGYLLSGGTAVAVDAATKVADDAEAQYDIAKRQGDAMQICVQAGAVAAAQLQAQNEASYQKWKDIEDNDCARAGLPRQNRVKPPSTPDAAVQKPAESRTTDPESLYEFAKAKGDFHEMCVQARVMAAKRLEQKQEVNCKWWKGNEDEYCRLAGAVK